VFFAPEIQYCVIAREIYKGHDEREMHVKRNVSAYERDEIDRDKREQGREGGMEKKAVELFSRRVFCKQFGSSY
jgi:hypothetical protein